jgi:hypothetical protein
MNLFFIISGHFLPAPYDRKGAKDFLNGGLRRFFWSTLTGVFLRRDSCHESGFCASHLNLASKFHLAFACRKQGF